MSTDEILRRLRLFLLVLSSLLLAGTLVELWLVKHTQDAIQWVPFALCGLGLPAALTVLIRTRRATVLSLRVCMLVVLLGSLFGIYEHVANNIEFEREIHPNATAREVFPKALGGANPLLAPGMLAVAALLACAATYKYSLNVEDEAER